MKLTPNHKTMLGLLPPILPFLIGGFLMMLGVVAVQLYLPSVIGEYIDEKVLLQPSGLMLQSVVILFALGTTYCVLNALRFYLFDVAGNKVVIALRRKLFHNLIEQEIGFFDGQKTGELSSRLTVDVESIRDLLTVQLAVLVRTLAISIGGLGMLFYLSWQLAVLLLLVVPTSYVFGKWMGRKVRITSRNLQQVMANSLDYAQESFANIRQIHAFNRKSVTNDKYCEVSEEVLNTSLKQGAFFAFYQGISSFITCASLILVLWFGAQLIIAESLTIGELTSFVMYAAMTTFAFTGVLGFWAQWQSTSGASERIFSLMGRQALQKRSAGPERVAKTAPKIISGNINFKNVSFSYPQRPGERALSDVSFAVKQGEKVAFVGASGAGKSTIAALILGFYEPDGGDILFEHQPYSDYERVAINERIALVEQEPNLFSGTIASNIAFGAPDGTAPKEQIYQAAKLANAHEFIEQFEHGYETQVGQNGVQLSGGQKQRIAIARAILRDPAILILDEASSALDADSEEQVQSALNHLMTGRTTLIIAHRLSTIVNADQIVVLNKGRTVQTGGHAELLQDSDGLYKNLIAKQLQQDAA